MIDVDDEWSKFINNDLNDEQEIFETDKIPNTSILKPPKATDIYISTKSKIGVAMSIPILTAGLLITS